MLKPARINHGFIAFQFFKSVGEGWIYHNPLCHRLTLEQQANSQCDYDADCCERVREVGLDDIFYENDAERKNK